MQDPSGYLRLLLALFRALSTAQPVPLFELFSREGLLQPTLRALTSMLEGPGMDSEKVPHFMNLHHVSDTQESNLSKAATKDKAFGVNHEF